MHSLSALFKQFSRAAAMLNKKLCKFQSHTFDGLNKDETVDFKTQEAKGAETPVLSLPRLQGACIVARMNVESILVCALRLKEPDRLDRAMVYWSCFLNDAECTYDKTHYQCHGVVCEVLLSQTYLEGCQITVQSHLGLGKWIPT